MSRPKKTQVFKSNKVTICWCRFQHWVPDSLNKMFGPSLPQGQEGHFAWGPDWLEAGGRHSRRRWNSSQVEKVHQSRRHHWVKLQGLRQKRGKPSQSRKLDSGRRLSPRLCLWRSHWKWPQVICPTLYLQQSGKPHKFLSSNPDQLLKKPVTLRCIVICE